MIWGNYESKMKTVGHHSGESFLRYYLNYKKTRRPESVMLYSNGEWSDYPRDVLDMIKNDLEINKTVVEIVLNGHDLMLDFLHMCQVDLKTGLKQPIAWIDEAGSYFFPEVHVASDEESYNLCDQERMKLYSEIKVNEVDESKLVTCTGKSNGGENILHNNVGLVPYTEFAQGKLDLDLVQDMFLSGMSTFGNTDFEIMETYRCLGASMQARLELFHMQSEITKKIHGDVNFRYAWLPFYRGELSKMIEYGLGNCMLCATKCTYGVGVHLAAVTCPYASARYCDIDENGIRHLVLCRVIMGNMEVLHPDIDADTSQFQPSSFEYDNGVDDIQCPRYYIVWNMNINTHIYSEFVVSFKVSEDVEGYFCGTKEEHNGSRANSSRANSANHGSCYMLQSTSLVDNGITTSGVADPPKIPKSHWLPLHMLIGAISDKVHVNDMTIIKTHYELYKTKQISRNDFVKELRLIVGDTILRTTITNLQFKVPSNDE
ncbi:inactive poly [ADP-ribose] polymerase RCD1-like [Lotus japonicus]|uniref:inactive poly [ADP-ribose] polymerase RCD1-like n=1 Tax=Lotus japonicus TaxID=34305 RepID=UPI0025896567|nr:inactive poly [ADP-ribose] polymerase RCD1-like [Lotus japonicus]